jgi:hypothetical protein
MKHMIRKNLRSLVLICIAAILLFLSYAASEKSMRQAIEESVQFQKEHGFTISDTPQDLNYYDLAAIQSLILGASCLTAAIWLIRK